MSKKHKHGNGGQYQTAQAVMGQDGLIDLDATLGVYVDPDTATMEQVQAPPAEPKQDKTNGKANKRVEYRLPVYGRLVSYSPSRDELMCGQCGAPMVWLDENILVCKNGKKCANWAELGGAEGLAAWGAIEAAMVARSLYLAQSNTVGVKDYEADISRLEAENRNLAKARDAAKAQMLAAVDDLARAKKAGGTTKPTFGHWLVAQITLPNIICLILATVILLGR